jgi:hypothetical protein
MELDCMDSVVRSVIMKFMERSDLGRSKYSPSFPKGKLSQAISLPIYSIREAIKVDSGVYAPLYGTDFDRTDLEIVDWITHAQEEHMENFMPNKGLKKIMIQFYIFLLFSFLRRRQWIL